MNPHVRDALEELRRARLLLAPFSAGTAMESPLFNQEGGDALELSPVGRQTAELVLDALAPGAVRTWEASFAFAPAEEELRELVDTAQLTLQLLVAGAAGALHGPLHSGEIMHALHRLVESQTEALEIRSGRPPHRGAAPPNPQREN